jgi:hypothetical protein
MPEIQPISEKSTDTSTDKISSVSACGEKARLPAFFSLSRSPRRTAALRRWNDFIADLAVGHPATDNVHQLHMP